MASRVWRRGRFLLLALVVSLTVGCDWATKTIATDSLSHSAPLSYFGDTVRLQYALNPGAFLGLGASLPKSWRFWLISLTASVQLAAVAFVLLFRRGMTVSEIVGVSLMLGGGTGNLIDRWSQEGLVTDFLNLGVGPLRTGIFNVADMALCLGVAMLVCATLKSVPRSAISSADATGTGTS
jgi:signal peptidase II